MYHNSIPQLGGVILFLKDASFSSNDDTIFIHLLPHVGGVASSIEREKEGAITHAMDSHLKKAVIHQKGKYCEGESKRERKKEREREREREIMNTLYRGMQSNITFTGWLDSVNFDRILDSLKDQLHIDKVGDHLSIQYLAPEMNDK